MCLSSVDEKTKRITEGYKVFRVRGNRQLHLECKGVNRAVPVDKWLDEVDYCHPDDLYDDKIFSHWGDTYPRGWHIFKTYMDAKAWKGTAYDLVIRKVEVDRIVASGKQNGFHTVIVAKYIRIIKGPVIT